MINIQACEITFELDTPVTISRNGDVTEVSEVTFYKRSPRVFGLYKSLQGLWNKASTRYFSEMKDIMDEEEIEKAKAEAVRKQEEATNEGIKGAIKSLDSITFEDIMEEVDGMMALFDQMEIDAEKMRTIFNKILLSSDKRWTSCAIGGKPISDGIIDKIDYFDYFKMIMVYIAFFAKPVKSGQKKQSDQPSVLAMPAKEL